MIKFQITFISLILLLLISCSVEEENHLSDYQVLSKDGLMTKTINTLTSNQQTSLDYGTSNSLKPNIQQLNSAYHKILALDTTYNFIPSLLVNHGNIIWSYSYVNTQDMNNYKLCIPMIKDGLLSGYFRYRHSDSDKLTFYDVATLDEKANNFTGDIQDAYLLLEYAYFQVLINGKINDAVNSWGLNLSGYRLDEYGQNRVLLCDSYTSIEWTWIEHQIHPHQTNWYWAWVEFTYIICEEINPPGGGGGLINGNPNSGGNNGGLGDDGILGPEEEIAMIEECLETHKEKMDEQLSKVTFPCESEEDEQKIKNKLKAQAITNLIGTLERCPNPYSVLSELEKELEKLDGVEQIGNNLTDQRLRCIWEKLSSSNDGVFCNTFSNFFGESNIDLNLQNSEQVATYAQTTYYGENSPYGHTIDIAFNQNQMADHCEITILGTFLHEGIHAEMFRQLKDERLDINSVSEIWNEYDKHQNDHDNMAESYILLMINALKEFYGNQYTDLEYEAIAWHGLGNVAGENVNTLPWNNLSLAKKNTLISAFNSVNENCDTDDCK